MSILTVLEFPDKRLRTKAKEVTVFDGAIKTLIDDKDYKVVLYSYCGNGFKKVDYCSNCDPEIHVGYLSQTYSGKLLFLWNRSLQRHTISCEHRLSNNFSTW